MPDLKNDEGLFAAGGDTPRSRDGFEVFKIALRSEELNGRSGSRPCNSLTDLVQWYDDEKARHHISAKREGLSTLQEWKTDSEGHFVHHQGLFFRILGVDVSSTCREVSSWSQPILDNSGTGIIGLLTARFNHRTHFLMQAKADVGNRNIVQIGPTVQFNPGNYVDNETLKRPFLFEFFMGNGSFKIIYDGRQSEEGGRFYREDHVHRILLLPDGQELEAPRQFRWFTLEQIRFFLHMGDFVNSCARSILSLMI